MSECECEHEGVCLCVCIFLNKKSYILTWATFLPGALEQYSHLSLAIKDNSGKGTEITYTLESETVWPRD